MVGERLASFLDAQRWRVRAQRPLYIGQKIPAKDLTTPRRPCYSEAMSETTYRKGQAVEVLMASTDVNVSGGVWIPATVAAVGGRYHHVILHGERRRIDVDFIRPVADNG
jgi:hypothetical protein